MKLQPPRFSSDDELSAFTIDFEYTLFEKKIEVPEPTFLTYGIEDAEGRLTRYLSLFLPIGRVATWKNPPDVRLYKAHGWREKIPTRITVLADKTGYKGYIDEKLVHEGARKWKPIPLGGTWVLGQYLRRLESGLKISEQFKGTICSFQMWDFKMTDSQLHLLFSHEAGMRGNIFDSPPSYVYEQKTKNFEP